MPFTVINNIGNQVPGDTVGDGKRDVADGDEDDERHGIGRQDEVDAVCHGTDDKAGNARALLAKMLDERRDGENGDNRRSDHDAVDNGLQRDVTQVVLAEIHHHGVVGVHGRNGKQRKQDNCSQVLVGENDLEIRAECARLLAGLSRSLLLGLSIDTDMLARSQKQMANPAMPHSPMTTAAIV